jgi:alginate O-acetyltransferase complex protein AlgI
MVFSSLIFIFYFLPFFFLFYYGFKKSNIILLIFSLIFYCWGDQKMVFIMLFSACLDFFCGYKIDSYLETNRSRAKSYLKLSIIGNVLILFYFKYYNFFIEEVNEISVLLFQTPIQPFTEKIILPLGISFYTFQSMSYTIDIFQKRVKPTKSIIDMLTYVTMFPQLIAGPIVRYSQIQSDLKKKEVTKEDLDIGLQRFLLGFSKKVLIANNIEQIVKFNFQSFNHNFYESWLAGLSFMVQVYFDFSAYSDMAIGLGRMLGFKFPENFRTPYRSRSVKEFWTRWHITLSMWLRDYIYYPLGGSHKGNSRTYLNIGIVFLICGLWHGADWTFIVWGLYQAFFICIERFGLIQRLESFPKFIQHFYFLLVTFIGFIFIRAQDLPQALDIIFNLFKPSTFQISDIIFEKVFIYNHLWLLIGILLCFPIPRFLKDSSYIKYFKKPEVKRLILLALFSFSIIELSATKYQPFFYFRF